MAAATGSVAASLNDTCGGLCAAAFAVHQRVLGIAAGARGDAPEDLVVDGEAVDILADLADHAGDLRTQHGGKVSRLAVTAPERIFQSTGFTPAVRTSTSSSPGKRTRHLEIEELLNIGPTVAVVSECFDHCVAYPGITRRVNDTMRS